jgi:tetratricopeptide (TPR) repeat protein
MAKKAADDALFEIAFYEKVLGYAPDFIEALACLGELYTRQGLFEKGLRVDERLVRLRPEDPMAVYNLACSQSLVNDIPASRKTMMRAIGLGYDEWDHLRKDPDLANLLADGEFQAFLKERCLPAKRSKRAGRPA